MVKKLMIKESNNKTIYDDIVKKVLTPYLEPYAKSAIKLFDSPFSVYNENRGLVTIGESVLGNIAYNYAKENGYSSAVLNLVGNYYDVDSALVISVKDGRQRTYPRFKNIARNLSGSLKKELDRLSIKLNDVVRDIANELIKEFKGVTNESMKRDNYKIESISKPENKFINGWASSLSMYIPTDYRDVIKYQNKSSRKSAFNQLEHIVWRLPIYSSLMADIHERSADISTTDDPYEFENYYYTLVMNKLLDMILKDMIPFEESPYKNFANEDCGKKMKKEAFDPDKLERTAKTNKRDFAEIISNELADMDWRDYVDGNYDTEDEAWEAFVDMTYQTLLKEPETIVDYLEDIDTAKSDELIKLINKYYII